MVSVILYVCLRVYMIHKIFAIVNTILMTCICICIYMLQVFIYIRHTLYFFVMCVYMLYDYSAHACVCIVHICSYLTYAHVSLIYTYISIYIYIYIHIYIHYR